MKPTFDPLGMASLSLAAHSGLVYDEAYSSPFANPVLERVVAFAAGYGVPD